MKILLIEDEQDVADLEKDLLKGYDIVHVCDIHDALEAKIVADYYKQTFDCVILDLKLPDTTPMEAMAIVNERFAGISVVVLSAFLDDSNVVRKAQEYGFFCIDKEFLGKAQTFLRVFNSAREASKRMRSLSNHLISGAWEVAATDTTKCAPYVKNERRQGSVTYKERTEARAYLMCMATVCITFLAMIGYWMFNERPIPYQLYIIAGCGLAIAVPLGVLPWVLAYFRAKNDIVKIDITKED